MNVGREVRRRLSAADIVCVLRVCTAGHNDAAARQVSASQDAAESRADDEPHHWREGTYMYV